MKTARDRELEYRLYTWRRQKPCSLCGTKEWRCMNTMQDGTRVCGQCALILFEAKKREQGQRESAGGDDELVSR